MTRSILIVPFLALLPGGWVFAEEHPLLPTEAEVDGELDGALEKAFRQPPPQPEEPSPPRPSRPKPGPLFLELGLSFAWLRLDELEIQHTNHLGGGEGVKLDRIDLDGPLGGARFMSGVRFSTRSGIRLEFGLMGAFRQARFTVREQLAPDSPLDGAELGRARLRAGGPLRLRLDMRVVDADLFLGTRGGLLEVKLTGGVRYVHWAAQVRGGERAKESITLDTAMPTVGMRVQTRPLGILQLFAGARAGTRLDSDRKIRKNRPRSYELDAGLTIRLGGVLAITAGYRVLYFLMGKQEEKQLPFPLKSGATVLKKTSVIESRSHGPFLQLSLEF